MAQKVSDAFTGKLLEALNRFDLNIKAVTSSGERGERRSKRRGQSVEYADHREYTFGDDLRRLDWHAYARLEQMLIRLYAAEEALPLEVIIDLSASMDFGEPSKYVQAARIGCCLTQIALLKGTPTRWRIASNKNLEPVMLRGRGVLPKILGVLDELVPEGTAVMAETLKRSALAGPRRKALVVLTDGYDRDAIRPTLRALRAGGTEINLILVLAPEETNPQERGEFTYIDSETGKESVLSLDGRALSKYMEMLAGYRAEWTDFCRASGIAMLEISSATPIDATLFKQLADGGLIA
ncbi:hypothetical protein PLCT2_00026 [Planctomycetaceae bacterium]|nr:hypothetical protein PLCT2_00026 [Planctomycetaceae bacterium]